jgi:hypothetical protein
VIYGYRRKTLSDAGLLELREVTFALSPTALRLLAAFLQGMANEIEVGTAPRSWHRHLSAWSDKWIELEPDSDVIVMTKREE